MSERPRRRRADHKKTELCTFEKIVETDGIATFRFFLWHDRPIVADLDIEQHATLLQAAFKLCHVDEKNALCLVGISYSPECEALMKAHEKLSSDECKMLTFEDPTDLLGGSMKADIREGEVWVWNISKEFAYPRGENSWDIWFHDVGHYGRQAVLNLTINEIMEITGDFVTVCLGAPMKMLEYAVLQPDGIFQKCHERAEVLGARIDFSVKMEVNQSELSVEYPFVPRPARPRFSRLSGKHTKKQEFEPNVTTSGSTRSIKLVRERAEEKTQRVPHVKSLGDTIRFFGKSVKEGAIR